MKKSLWAIALVLGAAGAAVAFLEFRGGSASLSLRLPRPVGEEARSAIVTTRTGLGPDDVFRLEGRLVEAAPPSAEARPLMVVAVTSFDGVKVAGYRMAVAHGGGWSGYGVLLPSGDYEVLVFDDADGDGKVGRRDLVGRSGFETPVGTYGAPDGFTVAGPEVRVDRSSRRDAGFDLSIPMVGQSSVVPLGDPLFADGVAGDGLWKPWKFVERTRQTFLYEPEAQDHGKIAVLFVHGVSGSPAGFAALASVLDPTRFQVWFAYYPSAFALDKLGAMVADDVEMLGARAPKLVLVAHSMGGLVCRSAIKHLTSDPGRRLPASLKGYVSFSSGYGGTEKNGVGNVPGWFDDQAFPRSFYDVVPHSDFLEDALSSPFPSGLPFHLFATSKDFAKQMDDGTIELWSQLEPRMVAHATKVHRVQAGHSEVLSRPDAMLEFAGVMEELVK